MTYSQLQEAIHRVTKSIRKDMTEWLNKCQNQLVRERHTATTACAHCALIKEITEVEEALRTEYFNTSY